MAYESGRVREVKRIPIHNETRDNILEYADNKKSIGLVNGKKPDQSITSDLIDSEQLRRKLFENIVWIAVWFAIFMFILLAFWIVKHIGIDKPIVWHIAIILMIPQTTILFILIKSLSKSGLANEDGVVNNTPTVEFFNQILGIIKTWLDKK